MEIGTLISLAAYFLLMLAIGLFTFRAASVNTSGYLLGGRQLGPAVTALSAGASDMSGWMVMGLPGALYLTGLSNVWIAVGLVIGAYCNYLVVAPRLRVYTELAGDSITLPEFFENRFEDRTRLLRVVSSLVIIVFFTVYTSSGAVAGGKLFESSFGLSYELGLYVTIGVVVLYTLFGGFLAVSLTDFVQGCIMFTALVLVPAVIIFEFGGYQNLVASIDQLSPSHLDLFAGTTVLGIVSSLAWGLGYFGQPHIIVRFMAIRSIGDIRLARRIGMSWMIVALAGAMATGLFGYAYVARAGIDMNDPETVFIVLSQVLFHPLIGGFMLAAILAAIMSTVSSQLLVTSSSLTEDVYRIFVDGDADQKLMVLVSRVCVLVVALIAIALASNTDSSILNIVANAWAGFGAAFGPLIVLALHWRRMTFAGALTGIVVGAGTVLIWVYSPLTIGGEPLSSVVYEIVPGVLLSTLAIIVVSLAGKAPSQSVLATFDKLPGACRRS
ncbi:sodium/proline symporter PutP [Seongchinamella sediminis]|uniref:Sodium/proline symporter n=1 Tax=Seongchinamella sediminis TaxID=2283635 RepID=A0A3L7E2C8_9GAMM|nr:sodium/proline symporter PutP [Seongchinamella sediminis]RLQ22503.1 sodium/proline symporter PutP [Seongchinamella sediminis]